MLTQNPVTVFLPISTVVVTAGGMQVNIPIQIKSTSETALVSVTGLPAGVQERYAASDTNPSGTMTFTAAGTAPAGTRMPIVTVISAGQTVNTPFTLTVKEE
jgi:Flp pilus assembly protein TadG